MMRYALRIDMPRKKESLEKRREPIVAHGYVPIGWGGCKSAEPIVAHGYVPIGRGSYKSNGE